MIRLILIPILLLLPIAARAQTTRNNRCVNAEETCVGEGCTKRVAVIFGKAYLVPKLKIRLIDKNTGKPAAGAKMSVGYNFRWLEYPYYPKDEHPLGVWTDAAYATDECFADDEGVIEVDAFKVEPHGYYKGIHSVGKTPKFTTVSIRYDLPYVGSSTKHCATSTDFTRSQLEKCRRKGLCEFTIRDGCPPNWR